MFDSASLVAWEWCQSHVGCTIQDELDHDPGSCIWPCCCVAAAASVHLRHGRGCMQKGTMPAASHPCQRVSWLHTVVPLQPIKWLKPPKIRANIFDRLISQGPPTDSLIVIHQHRSWPCICHHICSPAAAPGGDNATGACLSPRLLLPGPMQHLCKHHRMLSVSSSPGQCKSSAAAPSSKLPGQMQHPSGSTELEAS